MNKKNIIIFSVLAVLAIALAFVIVNYIVYSNGSTSVSDTKTKYSQDFIDVSNEENTSSTENNDINISDNIEESISDEQHVLDKDENIEGVAEEEIKKIDNEKLKDSEVYKDYYQESLDADGNFASSDIRNTTLNDYENVIDNKVSEDEIKFFNNLKILADNYTLAYAEMLSYIGSSDYDSLEKYLNSDYKESIEEFSKLDTLNNEKFEKVKSDYYNGMLKAQEGFTIYVTNPGTEDGNESFYKSDEYFYNGQSKLKELLDGYKN